MARERRPALATENKPRPRSDNPKLVAQLRALVPKEAHERCDLEAEILESDNPAEAIVQEAERFGADVICLGSHGRTGLAKAFLGSIAQGVMTQSKRPVFVVRARDE